MHYLFIYIPAVVLLIIIPIFYGAAQILRHFASRTPQEMRQGIQWKRDYPELVLMGVAPLVGIALVYLFKAEIHPFDLKYAITIGILILMAYFPYWTIRLFRDRISLTVNAMLFHGLVLGQILYILLAIHFISPMTVLGVVIFPYLGFTLLAPALAIFWNWWLLRQHQEYMEAQLEVVPATEDPDYVRAQKIAWLDWGNHLNWMRLLGVLIVVQVLLFAFGQPIDAVWEAFRGGEDFLFSRGFDWQIDL